MAAVDLAGVLARLHVFPHELARACAVSARTVRRWQRVGAPAWVARVLEARAGLIPLPGWQGWRARPGGVLRDDYGVEYAAADLRALPYLHQLAGELRRQLAAVTAERDALAAQLTRKRVRCMPRRRAGSTGSANDALFRSHGGGGAGGGVRGVSDGTTTAPAVRVPRFSGCKLPFAHGRNVDHQRG